MARANKIISRDEVRLASRGTIATLPTRGCRAKRQTAAGLFYIVYVPIKALWLPLVRRLKVEMPMPRGARPVPCDICGTPFLYAWLGRDDGFYSRRVCSDLCAAEWRKMLRRERRQMQAEEHRNQTARICAHCERPLQARRITKRYCTTKCRVADYRSRRTKAARREGRS
jgi:hypothetical protein